MLLFKFFFLSLFSISLFAGTIDLNKISNEAVQHKKIVMVFFHTNECPYCRKMLMESFDKKSDKDIINKDYYFIDVNIDSPDTVIYKNFKGTTAQFADFFHIKFYPNILFMEHNVVIQNIKGYRNKEKFRTILKYVSTKSYESMDLETFTNEMEMKE
jgi:thioredoxin-related protein